MQYKLVKDKPNQIMYIDGDWHGIIPFDPANTDYQAFKQAIADGAELQDADGNVVADAQDFIRNLP